MKENPLKAAVNFNAEGEFQFTFSVMDPFLAGVLAHKTGILIPHSALVEILEGAESNSSLTEVQKTIVRAALGRP